MFEKFILQAAKTLGRSDAVNTKLYRHPQVPQFLTGDNPFVDANQILQAHGETAIQWLP